MSKTVIVQLGLAAILIALGLSGLLMPYNSKWNPLGLRRGTQFTDTMYRKSPKVLGSVMVFAGALLLIVTALGYRVSQ